MLAEEHNLGTHREFSAKPENPIVSRLNEELSKLIPYGMPPNKREAVDDENRTVSALHPHVLVFSDYSSDMDRLHHVEGNVCKSLLEVIDQMLQSNDPHNIEQGQFIAKRVFRSLIDSRLFLVDFRKLLREHNIPYYQNIPHDAKSIHTDEEHKRALEEEVKVLFEEYEDKEKGQPQRAFSYNPDHIANSIDGLVRTDGLFEIQSEYTVATDFDFKTKGRVSFRKDRLNASLDLSFLQKYPSINLKSLSDRKDLRVDNDFYVNSGQMDAVRERGFETNEIIKEYLSSAHTPYAMVVDAVAPTRMQDIAAAAVRGIGKEPIKQSTIEDIHQDLLQHVQFDEKTGVITQLSIFHDPSTNKKEIRLNIQAPEGQYNVTVKDNNLVISSDYPHALASSEESYLYVMTRLNRMGEIVAKVNQYLEIQCEPSDLVVNDRYTGERAESKVDEWIERLARPEGEKEDNLAQLTLPELLRIDSDSGYVHALGRIINEYGLIDKPIPPELIQPVRERFGSIVDNDGNLLPSATTQLIRDLHHKLSPIEVPTIPVRRIKAYPTSVFNEVDRIKFNQILSEARQEMSTFRARNAEQYLLQMGDEATNFIRTFTDEQLKVMFPDVFSGGFKLIDGQGYYMDARKTVEELLRAWNNINQKTRGALIEDAGKLNIDIFVYERFIGKGYVSEEFGSMGRTLWFDLVDRMDNTQGKERLAGSGTLEGLSETLGKSINELSGLQDIDMTFALFFQNIKSEVAAGKTPLEALRALKRSEPKTWEHVKQVARARLLLNEFILGKTIKNNVITPIQENLPADAVNDVELQLQGIHSPILFAQHVLKDNDRPTPYGLVRPMSLPLKRDKCSFISGPNMSGKSQIVMTCLAALSGAPLPAELGNNFIKIRKKNSVRNKIRSFITGRDDQPTLSTFQNEARHLLQVLSVQWGFVDESGGGATNTMQEALQDALALLDGSVLSVIHDAKAKAETLKTLYGKDFDGKTAWYTVQYRVDQKTGQRERVLVPNMVATASGGVKATQRGVFPSDYLALLQVKAKEAGISLNDMEVYQAMGAYSERHAEKDEQFINDADLDKLGYGNTEENSEVKKLLVGLLEEKVKRLDLKAGSYDFTSKSASIATDIMDGTLKWSIANCMADDSRRRARERLAQGFASIISVPTIVSLMTGQDEVSALTDDLSALTTLAHIGAEGFTLIPVLQDLAGKKINLKRLEDRATFLARQEFYPQNEPQGTNQYLAHVGTMLSSLQNLLNSSANNMIRTQTLELELRNSLAKKAFEAIKRASSAGSPNEKESLSNQIKEAEKKLTVVQVQAEQDVYQEFLNNFYSGLDRSEIKTLTAIFQRAKTLASSSKGKASTGDLHACLNNVIDQHPTWYFHIHPDSRAVGDIKRKEFEVLYQALKLHTDTSLLSDKVVGSDLQSLLSNIDNNMMSIGHQYAVDSLRGLDLSKLSTDISIKDLMSQLPEEKRAVIITRMIGIFLAKKYDYMISIDVREPKEDLKKFMEYLKANPSPAERKNKLSQEISEIRKQLTILRARQTELVTREEQFNKVSDIPDTEWLINTWDALEKKEKMSEERKREARILVNILRSGNTLNNLTKALHDDLSPKQGQPALSDSARVSDFVDAHENLSYFARGLNQIFVDTLIKSTIQAHISQADYKAAREDMIYTMTVFAFSRLFHELGKDAYCKAENNGQLEFMEGINLQTVAQLGNRWADGAMKRMEETKTKVRVITSSEIIREGKRQFRRMSLTADNVINFLTGRNGGGKSTIVKGAMGALIPAKVIGLAPARKFVSPEKLKKARMIESRGTGIDLSAHMGGIVEIRDAIYGADANTWFFCDETNKGTSHLEELVENRTFLEYCLQKGIRMIFINHDKELVEGVKNAHQDKVGIFGISERYKVDKTNVYVPPGSIEEVQHMGWPPKTVELVQTIHDLIEKREKSAKSN